MEYAFLALLNPSTLRLKIFPITISIVITKFRLAIQLLDEFLSFGFYQIN